VRQETQMVLPAVATFLHRVMAAAAGAAALPPPQLALLAYFAAGRTRRWMQARATATRFRVMQRRGTQTVPDGLFPRGSSHHCGRLCREPLYSVRSDVVGEPWRLAWLVVAGLLKGSNRSNQSHQAPDVSGTDRNSSVCCPHLLA